jgi:hypothetical protein
VGCVDEGPQKTPPEFLLWGHQVCLQASQLQLTHFQIIPDTVNSRKIRGERMERGVWRARIRIQAHRGVGGQKTLLSDFRKNEKSQSKQTRKHASKQTNRCVG